MASSTATASCIFQLAEGHTCGDAKVYGTGKNALRFCWAHYVLRCAECGVKQALFECAMLSSAGTVCRLPMCSVECYTAHQQKHHPMRQREQKKVPIQVVFADGSIHDHMAPESSLTDEIVFEHPQTRERARCLRKPSSVAGAPVIYAELPRTHKPMPPPLELPRAAASRSNSPFQGGPQNAVTAFALHVSWLTALLETRDERIMRALPVEILQRLETALVETTVALLESNHHVG